MEAYTDFASVYDELMDNTPYERWCDNIVKVLGEYGIRDGLVLDMGCGTGVLAIVAAKRGAATVDAVDIDEWAEANCRENAAANGLAERIVPMLGDAGRIAGRKYDFIAANINRNILTMDMPAYAEALDTGGDLLMSGFLEEDVPVIEARARACGLDPIEVRMRDGWAMVHVKKA